MVEVGHDQLMRWLLWTAPSIEAVHDELVARLRARRAILVGKRCRIGADAFVQG